MKPLGANDIREKFLSFFEAKEHVRLKSFPLVPVNDNSLLLVNSGMAPLKPYFTGQEIPPGKRVVTCQKCIRMVDVDNVGITSRHGTFFEMLGNFSFGDYFKEEVIPWAWEFFTKIMEIPENRLFISVYEEDDEAYDIWNKKVGIPTSRIVKLGKDDNFWEVGIGPCGPCSEIYFDRGEKYGCGKDNCAPGCECDRFVEIWNLVFTQFNKEEDGSYSKLAYSNIDTGMGLERISSVMQGVESLFDIDTIKAINNRLCEIAGIRYNEDTKKDISIRIITDHIRSVTFLTADGVMPSNEGRGYVLRRLLRRAAVHGRLLGLRKEFLSELCEKVIEIFKSAYPELEEKKQHIINVLATEEKRFGETLEQGLDLLNKSVKELKSHFKKILAGSDVFKLYDTFGFPLELMKEILSTDGIEIDEETFRLELDKQREKARSARGESSYMGADETVYNQLDPSLSTEFAGYNNINISGAKVLAIVSGNEIVPEAGEGTEVSVILDKTVFYAESGGQKCDVGKMFNESCEVEITGCMKAAGKTVHIGVVKSGEVRVNDSLNLKIDEAVRLSIMRNHTSTHLLQKALREVLGSHVEQSGSSVSDERLRFDFTHYAALTRDELLKVEDIVNEKILEGLGVEIKEMDIDEARKIGAMALFGEKYSSVVRVVDISGYSIELCGGTHLSNTALAGSFKILSESGIAAGVRRIEAVTGKAALSYYRNLDENMHIISSLAKAAPENIVNRVKSFISEAKMMHQEIERYKSKIALSAVDEMLIKEKFDIKGFGVVATRVDGADMNSLRGMGDKLKDKIKSGVIILSGVSEDKANLLVMATDDAVKNGVNAGGIIKAAAEIAGGSGGGRPNMAQAGVKDKNKIKEALDKAIDVLKQQLGNV